MTPLIIRQSQHSFRRRVPSQRRSLVRRRLDHTTAATPLDKEVKGSGPVFLQDTGGSGGGGGDGGDEGGNDDDNTVSIAGVVPAAAIKSEQCDFTHVRRCSRGGMECATSACQSVARAAPGAILGAGPPTDREPSRASR